MKALSMLRAVAEGYSATDAMNLVEAQDEALLHESEDDGDNIFVDQEVDDDRYPEDLDFADTFIFDIKEFEAGRLDVEELVTALSDLAFDEDVKASTEVVEYIKKSTKTLEAAEKNADLRLAIEDLEGVAGTEGE